ncbi:MAG: flagellar filament capping protein FliD [Kofleriaceae bacterium]
MSSSISFSGLASGLDTSAMVEKLVALERSQANSLTAKQSDLNTHKSIVGSMSSALAALGTAVRGLDLATEVQPRGVTVSDTKVSVAVSSGATATSHDLRVKQLAAAQVSQSKTFPSSGALGADGGVDITVGGATKSVTWSATDTLADVAGKINSAGAGVTASVLFDGTNYRLMVGSNAAGTAGKATFADTGTGLDFGLAANIKMPAKDAIVSIDGVEITRSSNVISDALTGVTLTLNGVHQDTDAASKAGISLDTKSLTDKVKAMVTAYNGVNSALHIQLDYNGTRKGTNTLFGDTALRQLQGSLGNLMGSEYGGSNLGMLGISRDRSGTMTLDETKLAAAVTTDPDAVGKVFITGGFATALTALADSYTQSGTGVFATKSQSISERFTGLQTQIDRINRNADSLQTRLEKQFADLEQAMSSLQRQSASLSAML